MADSREADKIWDIVRKKFELFAPSTKSGLVKALRMRQNGSGEVIPDLSSLQVKTLKSGEMRVSFFIDLDAHPEARALEFGSGTHSTRSKKSPHQVGGNRGPIKIEGRPFLAFEWEVTKSGNMVDKEALHWSRLAFWKKRKAGEVTGLPAYAGEASDGKLLFNYVLHPGVAPYRGRGYLKHSILESVPAVRKQVGEDAAAEIQKAVRSMRKFTKVKA